MLANSVGPTPTSRHCLDYLQPSSPKLGKSGLFLDVKKQCFALITKPSADDDDDGGNDDDGDIVC